jgi:hypothetical protein
MASIIRVTALAAAAAFSLTLAGCANDGSTNLFGPMTTASIPEKPKVDPACVALNSQIDALKKEGVDAKIEKAAIKKYKMTQADLTKASQLNKANAEFQAKCSTMTQTAMVTPATATSSTGATTASAAPMARVRAAEASDATAGGQ